MTPKEFKAWFEGFTEAMDGQPTPAQWAKVKERVAQIDGATTSYPVYVDRYLPRRYWDHEPYRVWRSALSGDNTKFDERFAVGGGMRVTADGVTFNPENAMRLLGSADYNEMARGE